MTEHDKLILIAAIWGTLLIVAAPDLAAWINGTPPVTFGTHHVR